MPTFMLLFLVLIIWIRYENSKSKKMVHEDSKNFWVTENNANLTRKSDLLDLDYIKIPIDQLPFMDTEDSVLQLCQKDLMKLSEKKILNLTGICNTTLKQTYGISNLNLLSSYDENFTMLVRVIYKWGKYLYDQNYKKEAFTVLMYGITCGSDISGNYLLLANMYKEQHDLASIDLLIEAAENINSLLKVSILSSLNDIKNT